MGEKVLKEKEIQAKIRDEHFIRAIVVFELIGKPKDHIEKTLKNYVANIKSDSRIIIIREDYADTVELEDGMFSTFVELEMLVENLEVLSFLAINFAPASIEIIEPSSFELKAHEVTGWYNDLISKVHEVSTVLRTERLMQKQLTSSLNSLVKNAILLSLKTGPKKLELLSKDLGISGEQLIPFLKDMEKNNHISSQGEVYKLK